MGLRIEAACNCNIGRRRANNEDNFYFAGRTLPSENRGLKASVSMEAPLSGEMVFGVFDGMGGEKYGEEASYMAAKTAKESLEKLSEYVYPPRDCLNRLLDAMNGAVCQRARELKASRMGSTAVMMLFTGSFAYVANLGDSRAFRLRNGELLQLSEDHTDAKFLQSQGITGRKPGLTQHLGIWPEEMVLEPYIAKGEIQDRDRYLLCSDGLTDMLTNVDICTLMKEEGDICHLTDRLVAAALEKGGHDNVTVIAAEIHGQAAAL